DYGSYLCDGEPRGDKLKRVWKRNENSILHLYAERDEHVACAVHHLLDIRVRVLLLFVVDGRLRAIPLSDTITEVVVSHVELLWKGNGHSFMLLASLPVRGVK